MGNRAITEPLALTTDYVSIDGRYTDANGNPYASVSAAETALGRRMNQYAVGLTVLVKESGWTKAKEYWVQPKGTTPETYGLVEKGGEDLTKALSLSGEQKYNASANINDRAADVAPVTNEVKALGYKVLNPSLSFAAQVESTQSIDNSNTVFEIRDEFDLGCIITENELSCTTQVTVGSTSYYIEDTPIELSKGVAFSMPNGCVALKATTSGGVTTYSIASRSINNIQCVDSAQTIYIASKISGAYTITIYTGEVELPSNCTLYFNGGKLKNGIIRGNNTTIKSDGNAVFNRVKIIGSYTNQRLNVNLFGIVPNEPTIDAAEILRKYIESYNGDIYFPVGNYYFSEYYFQDNNNTHNLNLVGEGYDGLQPKTVFNPYYTSQRYIIKIGGNPNEISGTPVAHRIKIMDIAFNTPQGYIPQDLSITIKKDSTDQLITYKYPHAALVLDGVAVGTFGISGTVHNTPLIMIGYVGEGHFNYINCYTTHGKSDLPVITTINRVTLATTACICDKIECETICGPVWGMAEGCAVSEFLIKTFMFEGTVTFGSTREELSDQQLENSLLDYENYTRVPIFDAAGTFNIHIQTMNASRINLSWLNSLDPLPETEDELEEVEPLRCTRTLFRGTNVRGVTKIDSFINALQSSYVFIEGTYGDNYRNGGISMFDITGSKIILKNDTTCVVDVPFKSLYVANDKIVQLRNGLYIGEGLKQFANKTDNTTKYCVYRWYNAINDYGLLCGYQSKILPKFRFSDDCKFINVKGFASSGSTAKLSLVYYNSSDVVLKEQTVSTSITSSSPFYLTIPVDDSVEYSYLSLGFPSGYGYSAYIYSLEFFEMRTNGTGLYETSIPVGEQAFLRSKNKICTSNYVKSSIHFYGNLPNSAAKIITNPGTNTLMLVEFLAVKKSNTYTIRHLKTNSWSGDGYVETTVDDNYYAFYTKDATTYPYIGIQQMSNQNIQVSILKPYLVDEDGDVRNFKAGTRTSTYLPSQRSNTRNPVFSLGYRYYDINKQKSYYVADYVLNNNKYEPVWKDDRGCDYNALDIGTSSQRPTSDKITAGFRYYDTTLRKPIYWSGSIWTDASGEPIGLQVRDTSILLAADETASKTINVYSATEITAVAQNPDGSTTDLWLTATIGTESGGAYPLTLAATSANSTNPRGAKVIISNGTDVVIVNVVQNYATT